MQVIGLMTLSSNQHIMLGIWVRAFSKLCSYWLKIGFTIGEQVGAEFDTKNNFYFFLRELLRVMFLALFFFRRINNAKFNVG